MQVTGIGRLLKDRAGNAVRIGGRYQVMSETYPLYHLPYRTQNCFRVYYSKEEISADGKRYLMFVGILSPTCFGHVSVFEHSWNATREIHITLMDEDLLATQRIRNNHQQVPVPIYSRACATYFNVYGNAFDGYQLAYNDFGQRVLAEDCINAFPTNTLDAMTCLNCYKQAFDDFLNATFQPPLPEGSPPPLAGGKQPSKRARQRLYSRKSLKHRRRFEKRNQFKTRSAKHKR